MLNECIKLNTKMWSSKNYIKQTNANEMKERIIKIRVSVKSNG
jgi:ribosomal protein L33